MKVIRRCKLSVASRMEEMPVAIERHRAPSYRPRCNRDGDRPSRMRRIALHLVFPRVTARETEDRKTQHATIVGSGEFPRLYGLSGYSSFPRRMRHEIARCPRIMERQMDDWSGKG